MRKSNGLLLWLLLVSTILLTPALQAEEAYWEYTFRPGDTIWKLAKTYTTSVNNWLAIQKLNQIDRGNDRQIKPGERIKIPVSMLKYQPAPATVIATSDKVSLVRADGSRHTLAAYNKLYSGDTIITGADQFVSLRFADGSHMNILPGSEVSMDALSQYDQTGMIDTQVRLKQGNIDTRASKQAPGNRFEVITPSAVTAVRGTRFRVTSDASEVTRAEVVEGVVGVSAGESAQQVNAGYGVVAEKGKPVSPPVKLLDAPVATFNDNKISWQALDGAKAYRYQLASDAGFNHILQDKVLSGRSADLSALTPGDYHARLRGIDAQQLQGLNTQLAIAISPPPPPVEEPEADIWPLFIPPAIFLIGL
ncbi:MAG TPA: LysM peptidoglycan-binding domain-containing protein [Thiotrichales bacterium]|nr:LysM peptidoglycan-binding domain-containing protein [Thiotrichales bacterium]